MKKKRLLYISKVQFGHHTISYNYCRNLQEEFEIDFICFDEKKKKVPEFDINVIYLKPTINRYLKLIFFIISILKHLKNNRYDICFIFYFRFAVILKLFGPNVKMVMDVRTGAIDNIRIRKYLYDKLLKLEAAIFKNVTVGTKSLAEELGIEKTSEVLPIGAEIISSIDKNFEELKLLYVGVFDHRRIEETIMGFDLFLKQNDYTITYDIVGFGKNAGELRELVNKLSLSEYVFIHEYIPQCDIKPYFDKCNVGISYIPLVNYFQNQPVTKTFEYALSGMITLGTATSEHRNVINETNGILIDDSPFSFSEGLKVIFENRNKYNSSLIRKSCDKNLYNKIVTSVLIPYLKKVIAAQ